MNLGADMSIAGGAHLALERGRALGCNAVQIFVKSPSQWRARPFAAGEIERFRALSSLFAPGFVVGHASYLLNIASP
ncbi:MAG: deoxyribonuclease IV, partial [Candidatus Latescibacterota bacterium]